LKKQIKLLKAYNPGESPESLRNKYDNNKSFFKLGSNENVYGPSPNVKKSIINHVNEINYYPDTKSSILRKVISQYLNIDSSRIMFGSGLDEIILMISRAIVNKGDKIITSELTFGQYKHNGIIESADVIETKLKDGAYDLNDIIKNIDENTSMIWLCNPNNPTGNYFSEKELRDFLNNVPNDIPVLVDEAYFEFVNASDYPDTLKLQNYFRNLFVLRTFSKAYGLAGMRVGYVIAPQEIIEQWNIVKLPFNVGCLSEYAAVEAIKDQEYLRKICYYNKVEREKFFSIPESRNFYPSQTNFIFVKTENPNLLYEMLLEKGFITKLFSKGVRITIGLPEQNEGIIKVIKKFFK